MRKEFITLGSTSLIGTYGVNEENHTDFNFTIKNEPNAAIYFIATITGPAVNIQEGRWGFICDTGAN